MLPTSTLSRRIEQELQEIARSAEPPNANLPPVRPTREHVVDTVLEMVISVLVQRIQQVDEALARFPALRQFLADAEQPATDVGLLQEIAEQRRRVQTEEDGYRALRAQLMELMVKANPDDAWLWERENPAASTRITYIDGLLPYSRRLSQRMPIIIEQDEGEMLVSEPYFHMHAGGATTDEAIDAFRRIISGYVDVLEEDETQLGEVATAQLAYLRSHVVPE